VCPKEGKQNALKNEIASLSSKIMKLTQTEDARSESTRNAIKREAMVYEEKIDELVYELYGVTPEERKLIEGSARSIILGNRGLTLL
jgi:spore coat polysaccharide biosynthesis predicted glycosyltransferase SpsG